MQENINHNAGGKKIKHHVCIMVLRGVGYSTRKSYNKPRMAVLIVSSLSARRVAVNFQG